MFEYLSWQKALWQNQLVKVGLTLKSRQLQNLQQRKIPSSEKIDSFANYFSYFLTCLLFMTNQNLTYYRKLIDINFT